MEAEATLTFINVLKQEHWSLLSFVCLPLQKKAKGEELFEQIMYHLDIVEKDYFGIRFMDSAQVPVSMEGVLWLCTGCFLFINNFF